jgi:hypothetical protein
MSLKLQILNDDSAIPFKLRIIGKAFFGYPDRARFVDGKMRFLGLSPSASTRFLAPRRPPRKD